MAISELKAVLKLDFSEFKSGLDTAKSAMDNVAKGSKSVFDGIQQQAGKAKSVMGKTFNSLADQGDAFKNKQSSLVGTLGKTALGFVGIKSAADIFNSAIGRVDKIKSAEKSIEALTGSNKDAKTVMEGLQKVVDGTPLSLDSFTSSAKGMVAAGMEAGKVEGIMTAVGDAAFGVGDGAGSIDIMASAFKSLQASGTASLGDLNRLMDQNIPVYKILGNEMGKTVPEMKKFITDGMLPSGEAMDILAKGIEEGTDGINGSTAGMAGQMQTAGNTIEGAAGNIKTAFVKSLAVPITESYEKIVKGMQTVKDGIKAAQPTIEAVFRAIAGVVEGVILGMVDTFKLVKPAIDVVGDVISKLAGYFKDADSDGEGFKEMARKLTPIVVALFAAFKGYKFIAKTASTIRDVSKVLKGTKDATSILEKGMNLGKSGVTKLGSAFKFLAANPIVLIIGAIVALVGFIVYMYNTNEEFRNKVKAVWKAVKDFFVKGAEAAVNALKSMWEGIKSVWDTISNVFMTAVEFIWNIVQVGFMIIYNIIEGILLVIKSVIELVWEGIKAYFTLVFAIYSAIFTAAFNVLKVIVETVFNAIKAVVEFIWNGLVTFFTTVFEVISAIFTAAWEVITTIITVALEFITGIITAVWEGIKTVTEAVWNAIVAVLTPVWNVIKSVASTVFEAIKAVITRAWDTIKAVTSAVWNTIKAVITVVWGAIKSVITTAVNIVKSVITSVWNTIKAVTSAIWNGIKAVIAAVWNGIKSLITSAVNGVKNTVTTVWNAIKSVTSTVWNGIKSAMTKPVEAASNVIKGIIDKIKGFFSGLKLKFPSIGMPPLPHFSLTGKFSLKPPSVPKLGVSWYKTGGIFTDDSVIGVGEDGAEAVLPLSNKGRMKPFAQAVSSMLDIPEGGGNGDGETRPILLNNTLEIDGRAFVSQVAKYIQEAVDQHLQKEQRKGGRR